MSSESSETANKDDEELPRETEDVRNDVESHTPPPKRPIHRALVQDFGPLWFTWCMNSGILAILLHELPYQFRGAHVISTIFFLIDVLSFILFSFVFIVHNFQELVIVSSKETNFIWYMFQIAILKHSRRAPARPVSMPLMMAVLQRKHSFSRS